MNAAFAAFLNALPTLLGLLILIGGLYGLFRGLTLRPKDPGDRVPDPVSPAQRVWDSYASPPVWPRWIRRLFGRS